MTIDVQAFNPKEHITKIKTKRGSADYLAVQWRLVWFRDQCPDGGIETELVQVDLEKGAAIFKATIHNGQGGMATGHGSETKQDFDDYLEKAETKAIGRALAALGYGTQFAPELAEGDRIVDSPVSRPASPLRNGDGSPVIVAAHTLMDVKEFFLKYFKPGQWRGFKSAEVGPVEDEALTDDELDILYKRLMVIDEDQKRRKAEPVAATSGK